VTRIYRIMGGAPKPLVRTAFRLSSGTKLLTKPIATLQHLDDAEWLAQIEAVDRFTANMIAYPGRTFGQMYHRVLKNNQLVTGKVNLSGHEINLANIKVPVLVFAGNTDGIAPIAAVKALLPLLKNAHEVRFEIVPGGHLGMLTGRAARNTTWVVMDDWIAQYSTPDDRTQTRSVSRPKAVKGLKAPAKKTPARKTAAGKAGTTRKAPVKKAASKSAHPTTSDGTAVPAPRSPADVAPDRSAIGSNRDRRFSSTSSRDLAPKR
jgi:polyhydroxyalkanoate synthase